MHEVNGKLMKTEHLELWKRVADFTFDDPTSAFPFSERLARDNGWPLPCARRVIQEYKRFAFLAVAAGHPVTPPDQVDQAWHLHLLYTQSYWKEFCGEVLCQPLHHGPTKGGTRERAKFNDWYARTLASYRVSFGEEPPADIWPAPVERFGDDIHFIRVNTARNWVVPKPAWMRQPASAFSAARRRIPGLWKWKTPNWVAHLATIYRSGRLGTAAVVVVLVLAGCTGDGEFKKAAGWPFDLTAGPFLQFFLVAWVAATGCAAWLRWRARTPAEAPDKPLPELDAYDMAFLAGGKNRASFAAVASLTHRGALEIDEQQHRLRHGALPDAVHAFEAGIHQKVARSAGSAFKEIADQCVAMPECARIEEKLKKLGLLTTALQGRTVCFIPMLIALLVPAIGFIKIVIGLTRDKPVGILIVLSVLSLVGALLFATRPHRTRRGDAVLARLREKYGELKSQVPLGESTLALLALPLAVGLFGPGVLNGTALDNMEKKLEANAGGTQGGGCGGGCGGGGCGGCGGCGG